MKVRIEMLYYHSTQFKDKILRDQRFKISKFDYVKYMNSVINTIYNSVNVDGNTFKEFCRSKLPAPKQYMGNGVYVFNEKDLAKEFQSDSEIIVLNINDKVKLLDYSEQSDYAKLVVFLSTLFPKWIDETLDENDAKAYNFFVKVALYGLTNDFKNDDAPLFGLIMFFVYEVYIPSIQKKSVVYPDVISYKFNNITYSIIKSKNDKIMKVRKNGIIEKIS